MRHPIGTARTEIPPVMAQLARCPACYSEIELPAEIAAGDLADARAQCPACDETFLLTDAKPRIVKQAVLVREEAGDYDEGAARLAATIDNPTLAAFLGLDKASSPTQAADAADDARDTSESDAEVTAQVPPAPAIDLGDFQSLDELFKASAERTTETSAPDDREPSPAADRMRPTLGELFAATTPTVSMDEGVDTEAKIAEDEDNVASQLDDYLDGIEHSPQGKNTVDEFSELTMHEIPVPKFEATDASDDVEVSKSLRAAMGFVDDDPLEAEDDERELVGAAFARNSEDHETLSFAQVEAPRGTVATRRRQSTSMLRTMFGVFMGGVMGLAIGYLGLLWIFHYVGRTDDPLDLAKFYPNIVKPAEFHSSAAAPQPSEQPLAANDDIVPLPATFGEENEVDQANFETEAPVADPTASTGEAPAALDAPLEAAPIAKPATRIAIEGAPKYTAAEVQQATEAASAVAADLVADGPLDQRKGSSYATLAQLADAVTFGEGNAQMSWKLPARQLFPQLFATPATQEDIAKIAGFWITSARRSHGGIFFSGTPDAGRQQGTVVEYQVTLPTGQVLTVLTPEPLTTTNSDPIVVVGSLVREPAEHIQGYTGSAETAVWSEHLLPVVR